MTTCTADLERGLFLLIPGSSYSGGLPRWGEAPTPYPGTLNGDSDGAGSLILPRDYTP